MSVNSNHSNCSYSSYHYCFSFYYHRHVLLSLLQQSHYNKVIIITILNFLYTSITYSRLRDKPLLSYFLHYSKCHYIFFYGRNITCFMKREKKKTLWMLLTEILPPLLVIKIYLKKMGGSCRPRMSTR